jgi:hypothetical protein
VRGAQEITTLLSQQASWQIMDVADAVKEMMAPDDGAAAAVGAAAGGAAAAPAGPAPAGPGARPAAGATTAPPEKAAAKMGA